MTTVYLIHNLLNSLEGTFKLSYIMNVLRLGESKNVQEETLSEATDEPKDDKKWLRNHLLLVLF